jgi:ABC-type multidrug transport system fused ATPase/permease subunit
MLLVALLLMIVSEALGLYNPLLIADAYNDLVDVTLSPGQRMARINHVMMLALILHFSSVALGFVRHAIMGVAGERVVARTRNGLYSSILSQEIGFFDVHKTGELVSRLGSDAALLKQGTSQALPEVMIGIIKVLVSVAIMFWISPKLAAVMIGFVLVIMVRNQNRGLLACKTWHGLTVIIASLVNR